MQGIDFSISTKRLRYSVRGVIAAISFTASIPCQAAELLEHISEDSAPPPTADQLPVDDRRITYRVICAPDGEQLPDCEHALHDRESAPQAPAKETATSQTVAEEAGGQPASTKRKSAKKTGSGKKHKVASKTKRKKARR